MEALVNTVVVPGFVSVMVSEVTRSVANTIAVAPVDSVIPIVAVKVPVCVGVPAMMPVVAPIETPVGRPSATYESEPWSVVDARRGREIDSPCGVTSVVGVETSIVVPFAVTGAEIAQS